MKRRRQKICNKINWKNVGRKQGRQGRSLSTRQPPGPRVGGAGLDGGVSSLPAAGAQGRPLRDRKYHSRAIPEHRKGGKGQLILCGQEPCTKTRQRRRSGEIQPVLLARLDESILSAARHTKSVIAVKEWGVWWLSTDLERLMLPDKTSWSTVDDHSAYSTDRQNLRGEPLTEKPVFV